MNEDKTWSVKHEGPLNKNNIVFKRGLVKKSVDTDDYDNAETWEELDKFDNTHESESKDMDDMWVCDYCGSEEVSQSGWVNINTEKLNDFIEDSSFWCHNCSEETSPMTYFDWQEKIAEECMGNKDKYDKIMDGSRA